MLFSVFILSIVSYINNIYLHIKLCIVNFIINNETMLTYYKNIEAQHRESNGVIISYLEYIENQNKEANANVLNYIKKIEIHFNDFCIQNTE